MQRALKKDTKEKERKKEERNRKELPSTPCLRHLQCPNN